MEQPVTLITGAGRGIGRASALELAQRGHRLALAARTRAELEEVQQQIPGALIAPADVANPDDIQSLVAQTLNAFGRIDGAVHCAGLAPAVSVEQMSVEQWRQVLEVNLSSAFYLARSLWPVFRKQGSGVVVLISSLASRDPFPGFAAYGAAKAGLNTLATVLAREGQALGVRVHVVAPGAVDTAMFRALFSPEQWPAEKTLSPQEVAQVIAACVCGDLRYTSGEVIFLSKSL